MKRWLRKRQAQKSLRSRCGHFAMWPEPRCEKKPTHYVRNLAGTKLWYCGDHGFGMEMAMWQGNAALRRGEKPDIKALADMAAALESRSGDTDGG